MIKYSLYSSKGGWYRPATKMKVYALAKHELASESKLYVRVRYGKNLYNHATINNISELKRFIASATEPELIKYVEGF